MNAVKDLTRKADGPPVENGVEWRFVRGYGRMYAVDATGGVWSSKSGGWRRLKTDLDKDGYPRCYLRRGGRQRTRRIHRIVLEAFVGRPRRGEFGCHIDGNPVNCRLDNLRFADAKANAADRERHGRTARGSRVGTAKLTEADVIGILKADGTPVREAADRLGVSESAIRSILNGETWRHLQA